MSLKNKLRARMRCAGWDIVRWPQPGTSIDIIRRLAIESVIDVGANTGQFATSLRSSGFGGRIDSFEPNSEAFYDLRLATELDPLWNCHNLALGSEKHETEMWISEDSLVSSLAKPTAELLASYPPAATVRRETVRVDRLDRIWEGLGLRGKRVLLKIDAQGHDAEVLSGASRVLPEIAALQIELAIRPSYEGQVPFDETIRRLCNLGFHLSSLAPVLFDYRKAALLECDGMFVRENAESVRSHVHQGAPVL